MSDFIISIKDVPKVVGSRFCTPKFLTNPDEIRLLLRNILFTICVGFVRIKKGYFY